MATLLEIYQAAEDPDYKAEFEKRVAASIAKLAHTVLDEERQTPATHAAAKIAWAQAVAYNGLDEADRTATNWLPAVLIRADALGALDNLAGVADSAIDTQIDNLLTMYLL
jgi:hypothetical protein